MDVMKALYSVLKQFERLVIRYDTEDVKLTMGTQNISYNNGKITGENLTLADVRSFTVGEEMESECARYLMVRFSDTEKIRILCI